MKEDLSTKDLSYVCDMFNWNLNIYNTANMLIDEVMDEELKKLLQVMMNDHKESCEKIVEVVK